MPLPTSSAANPISKCLNTVPIPRSQHLIRPYVFVPLCPSNRLNPRHASYVHAAGATLSAAHPKELVPAIMNEFAGSGQGQEPIITLPSMRGEPNRRLHIPVPQFSKDGVMST